MTGDLSIAAAQTVPERGAVGANLEEHARLARLAAGEGVRALVFPELSATGYELGLARELAFSEADPRLAPLRETSSALGLTLVVGAPVRLGERLFIGAFVLAPDGSLDLYTKHHLGAFPGDDDPGDVDPGGTVPPAEDTVFEPGDRDPLLRFDGHTAALAVCADTGRPAHAAAAAKRGAGVYLASMFFTTGELATEGERLRGYAARHGMVVACANFGGPTGWLSGGGGSAVWSERGERLVQLEGTGAGLAVARRTEGRWSSKAVRLQDA